MQTSPSQFNTVFTFIEESLKGSLMVARIGVCLKGNKTQVIHCHLTRILFYFGHLCESLDSYIFLCRNM